LFLLLLLYDGDSGGGYLMVLSRLGLHSIHNKVINEYGAVGGMRYWQNWYMT
jgi:hypothetical protein